MIYWVPNKEEDKWESKYRVPPGQYLCDKCNKPQIVTGFNCYLEPCKFCGSRAFWK